MSLQDSLNAIQQAFLNELATINQILNDELAAINSGNCGDSGSGVDGEERTRAIEAEQAILAQITVEVIKLQTVDASNLAAITSETARAGDVESTITTNLNQEISDRRTGDATERGRASTIEQSLQNQINDIQNGTSGITLASINQSIVDESTTRENEYSSINTNLNAEILDRKGTDANLQQNIDYESARSQGVENNLSNRITSFGKDITDEVTRAKDIEVVLQNNISNEVTARETDINDLKDQINSIVVAPSKTGSKLVDEANIANGKVLKYNSNEDKIIYDNIYNYTPEDRANRGAVNGYPSLVNGKIPLSQLPAMIINDTYVVSSESEMLALSANVGDACINHTEHISFLLKNADPSQLSSWIQIETQGGSELDPIFTASPAGKLTLQDVTNLQNISSQDITILHGLTLQNIANLNNITAQEISNLSNTSGINTGDETTTSIKSKLGEVSSNQDGYLSKENYDKFNNNTATQADYTENDNTKPSYIKNKPNMPTKLSEFTNDTGFIKDELEPAYNVSPAKDITAQDVINIQSVSSANFSALSNISGTNTGDETTSSIKSKLGYTPESISNKSTDPTLGSATPSDELYPSQKAVSLGIKTESDRAKITESALSSSISSIQSGVNDIQSQMSSLAQINIAGGVEGIDQNGKLHAVDMSQLTNMTSEQVIGALGYIPSNPDITVNAPNGVVGIDSDGKIHSSDMSKLTNMTKLQVTTALGFTPVNNQGDTITGELHATNISDPVYVRQSVLLGSTDSDGNVNYVSPSSVNVLLSASVGIPFIATLANGFSAVGTPIDIAVKFTSNKTFNVLNGLPSFSWTPTTAYVLVTPIGLNATWTWVESINIPSSANEGDYWHNPNTRITQKYNGSAWIVSPALKLAKCTVEYNYYTVTSVSNITPITNNSTSTLQQLGISYLTSGGDGNSFLTNKGTYVTPVSGAGLNANGTYSANSNANYIQAATSLNDADILLDTNIHNINNAIITSINTEISTARNNEASLQTQINSLSGGSVSQFIGNPYTIVRGAITNNSGIVSPSYITSGGGLTCNILGSNTPLNYIFASGIIEILNSDIAGISLSPSTTNYLFKQAGSDIPIVTTVAPVKSYYAPSNVNNKYWLDMGSSPWQMKVGDGTSWTVVNVIYLGSVATSASVVTTISARKFNENIQEDYHYVGATGEPAFGSGCANYTSYSPAKFMKSTDGHVYIESSIQFSSGPRTLFTLPSGYCPVGGTYLGGGYGGGSYTISPTGTVYSTASGSGSCSVNCVFSTLN